MDPTNRQDLPAAPGLWVVATPIGNLGDLSPRALRALSCADAVLCEDTRRTSRLCAAVSISPKLYRLDAHAAPGEIRRRAEEMAEGANYALVTDGGTPGISDPAAALVAASRERGVLVSPIPGPSAVVALLSVSGMEGAEFVFRGFFPRKKGERERELAQVLSAGALARVALWFESPERIVDALAAAAEASPESPVLAGKELTKLHEAFFSGSAREVHAAVSEHVEKNGTLGEWCFALELPRKSADSVSLPGSLSADEAASMALRLAVDAGVSASEAAKRVSQVFGVNKKGIYELALKYSGKK